MWILPCWWREGWLSWYPDSFKWELAWREGGQVIGSIPCRTENEHPIWLWSLKTWSWLKGCCALHLPKVETLYFCWFKSPTIEHSTLCFCPKWTFGGFSSCHIVGWSRSDPKLWDKLGKTGSTQCSRWTWRATPNLTALWFKASVLCDLLLLHFLHGRDYYKQKKFKYAEPEPVSKSECLPAEALAGVCVDVCMSNDSVTQTSTLRGNQAPSWALGTLGDWDPWIFSPKLLRCCVWLIVNN